MLALALLSAWVQDPVFPPLPPPRDMYVGNTARLHYSLSFREEAGTVLSGSKMCTNECAGQKHFLHATCDLSCDVPCREGTHKLKAGPYFHLWNIPLTDVVKDFNQFIRGTAPLAQHFENVARQIGETAEANKDQVIERRLSCWNEKPCSGSLKGLKSKRYRLEVTYQFIKEVRNEAGGVTGTQPLGAPKTCAIADLTIPTRELSDPLEYGNCMCHAVQYEEGEESFTAPPESGQAAPPAPPPPADKDRRTGATGVRLGTPEGALCGQPMLDKLECKFEFEDMNQGVCSASNPTMAPVTLCLPAGTWFDTDADEVQDVLLILPVVLKIPPRATVQTRVDRRSSWSAGSLLDLISQGPGKASATMRVMCMEMAKREPHVDVKYRPRPAPTPEFARIGQEISKAFGRGPWDQAKVWIYSDAATYADIEKKLIPSPSEGQYVRAMHDLLRLGVDMGDERYAPCYEPRLLAGASSEAAGKWFAGEMLRRDEAGVMAWVAGEGREPLLKLLESRPDQIKQFAIVAEAFCGSPKAEVQRAGLVLLAAVPDEARPKLAKENLLSAWSLCWSSDEALKGEAMKLMEAFAPPAKEFVLLNLPKG